MKKILIACLSLFALASCNKDVEELPPATQTGANTFGAKVNGEFWVPKTFGPFGVNDILQAHMNSSTSIIIKARNFASSPTETEFEIFLKDITGPATFVLNTNVSYPTMSASYGYYVKRKLSPENEWITSSSNTGVVTITKFDLTTRIVSGTFQFNALNLYNAPQPLTVTEGRFDIKIL